MDHPPVLLGFVIVTSLLSSILPSPSWSATDILNVELAHDIIDRDPALPSQPSAHCEKDASRNQVLPRIHTSDHQVVFWNRVAASDSTTIRHSWHRKSDEGWKPMAQVDLQIQKSSAFRIWSKKDLHPNFHRGEWMIVVSMAHDPKQVLCISRFIVE